MISKEEVEHIAKLARIKLEEQEVERFQRDLSSILDYFEILKSADIEGVEPMTHSSELKNVQREDASIREKPETLEKLIQMAPQKEKGFIKVPKVI